MSLEECHAFVVRAVSHAMARDGSSGGCIRTVVINKDGVTRDFIPGNLVPAHYGEISNAAAIQAAHAAKAQAAAA